MSKETFQLNCDFIFDRRIQNILYDLGPSGVLLYIQLIAEIEKEGGYIDEDNFERIAYYSHQDIRILFVLAYNYGLFESQDGIIWLKGGQNPFVKDDINVEELKKLPYRDYLQTDYWKKVAAKVKKDSKYKCANCGSSHRLEVHHLNYEHKGDELNHLEDLICLCHECHTKLHNK